jgi:hypothetical protein
MVSEACPDVHFQVREAVGRVDAARVAGFLADDGQVGRADALNLSLVPCGLVCGLVGALRPVVGESLGEFDLVEFDVQEGVGLLDHPREWTVDQADCILDPAQVAVAAGEGDLECVLAAHENRGKWLAFLVKSEGMEGKINICVGIDVRRDGCGQL